jgi:hypothetical protein
LLFNVFKVMFQDSTVTSGHRLFLPFA